MMRHTLKYALLSASILTLCPSCEHKDLCFDHDAHAPKSDVHLKAVYENEWEQAIEGGPDWETYPAWESEFGMGYDDLRPGTPDGLRVQVYNEDGTNNVVNLAPGGGTVRMRTGRHSLLLYNNDTECIIFDDMGSFTSAKATTRSRSRVSYSGNPYMGNTAENTVTEPDMLYGNYIKSYTASLNTEVDEIPITMHPLVFTYLVRYEFSHGLEYVALARGALAGMAGGVWLHSGRTSDEEATILYDCTLQDFGEQACVNSFGIPDYPNEHYTKLGSERKYALQLEVRLKNGKYLPPFNYDVTDQVAAQPQGGVIVVSGIEISDDDGAGSGSGFDVSVTDWGEYEDIELPL